MDAWVHTNVNSLKITIRLHKLLVSPPASLPDMLRHLVCASYKSPLYSGTRTAPHSPLKSHIPLNFARTGLRQATLGNGGRGKAVYVGAAAIPSFVESPALPVKQEDGTITEFPETSGVYAVYDNAGVLQYVGVSRKVNVSVATHLDALPELVGTVKVCNIPGAGKEELTEAWKLWIQQAGETKMCNHQVHV
jgi:hypothetical protein